VKLLVRIPWARKRFNPDSLKMLAFDGIYCESGYEEILYELMEGVLHQTGRYVAMLMMDCESGLNRIFLEMKKLGIIHKILGSFTADIRIRFINIPEEVREQFHQKPAYIPTYDNS
jgi:hypothetical protein